MGRRQRGFAETRWSLVIRAGRSDTPRAQLALAELCQVYWYPLYAYVRRRGHSAPDAEDLTQAFFAHVLGDDLIAGVDRLKGRFRSYLLTRLNHFLADEWDRRRAQKRGGGKSAVPLDLTSAETRYGREPADERSPDRVFEHRWAVTLLERVYRRLREEYELAGKAALFAALKGCLAQERAAVPYSEVSARLAVGEGALRVAAHRLRQRYRQLLREEVADTVSNPGAVEEELRYLFRVLSG